MDASRSTGWVGVIAIPQYARGRTDAACVGALRQAPDEIATILYRHPEPAIAPADWRSAVHMDMETHR